MIYLFDDNEFDQMSKNYGVDMLAELSSYSDLIKHIQKAVGAEGLEVILSNAKAIFIHASFPPIKFRSDVCKEAEKRDLPIVIFTGGEPAMVWDEKKANTIRQIKKDRFYHYLIPFLKYCKAHPDEPLEIRKLVFGGSYEIEKSLIIQDRLALFLSSRLGNFNYESDFIVGSQERKDLMELLFFLHPDDHKSEFLKFHKLFRGQATDAKLFFLEIKKIVTQIITKYE